MCQGCTGITSEEVCQAKLMTRICTAMQPKFQCAVPFTPVTGPRILIRDPAEKGMLLKAAAQTLMQLTGEHYVLPLSCHQS